VDLLRDGGIPSSLFVEPSLDQIRAAHKIGAAYVELHTGRYSNAKRSKEEDEEFEAITQAAKLAYKLGLGVNAGHDLDLENLILFRELPHLDEVSIGHALVAHALYVGLDRAVRDYLDVIGGR